jgi:hypothetical protein
LAHDGAKEEKVLWVEYKKPLIEGVEYSLGDNTARTSGWKIKIQL